MTNPNDRKYTKEHEWIKVNGDIGTVGITDYAQHSLTDIVFAELPPIGKEIEQAKPLTVLESVKSVSDVFSPVSGTVVEVNGELSQSPEKINKSPFEDGWIAKIKIKDLSQLTGLMTAEEYEAYLKSVKH